MLDCRAAQRVSAAGRWVGFVRADLREGLLESGCWRGEVVGWEKRFVVLVIERVCDFCGPGEYGRRVCMSMQARKCDGDLNYITRSGRSLTERTQAVRAKVSVFAFHHSTRRADTRADARLVKYRCAARRTERGTYLVIQRERWLCGV